MYRKLERLHCLFVFIGQKRLFWSITNKYDEDATHLTMSLSLGKKHRALSHWCKSNARGIQAEFFCSSRQFCLHIQCLCLRCVPDLLLHTLNINQTFGASTITSLKFPQGINKATVQISHVTFMTEEQGDSCSPSSLKEMLCNVETSPEHQGPEILQECFQMQKERGKV